MRGTVLSFSYIPTFSLHSRIPTGTFVHSDLLPTERQELPTPALIETATSPDVPIQVYYKLFHTVFSTKTSVT